MTTQRDLERALDSFFVAGADEVADRVIDDALLTIEHTPQRRALRVPWRLPNMSNLQRLATIAAAVVLALGGAAWILGRGAGTGGAGTLPTASPSPSAESSPSVAPSPTATPPSTTGWVTFTSTRYGYQIAHPPAWKATPAARDWVFATDAHDYLTTAADHFIDPAASFQILLTAWVADVPTGTTEDAWLTSYFNTSDAGNVPCGVTIAGLVPTTVDGHPGRVRDSLSCFDSQAFVFFNGRVHVFGVWRDSQEPLLRAFLSTVKFQSSSPSSPPGASPSPS